MPKNEPPLPQITMGWLFVFFFTFLGFTTAWLYIFANNFDASELKVLAGIFGSGSAAIAGGVKAYKMIAGRSSTDTDS